MFIFSLFGYNTILHFSFCSSFFLFHPACMFIYVISDFCSSSFVPLLLPFLLWLLILSDAGWKAYTSPVELVHMVSKSLGRDSRACRNQIKTLPDSPCKDFVGFDGYQRLFKTNPFHSGLLKLDARPAFKEHSQLMGLLGASSGLSGSIHRGSSGPL